MPRAGTRATYAPLASTSSGGGPVLLIPAESAAAWRGALAPGDGRASDYERACDGVSDFVETARGGLGWLPLGARSAALVLDLELETVWVPTTTGGIVVRGPDVSGRDPAGIAALIDELDDAAWQLYPLELNLRDGRVFLFDAAVPGDRDPTRIEANPGAIVGSLKKGAYLVEHAAAGTTDLVRLRRKSRAKRPPVTRLLLSEVEAAPPPSREWTLSEPMAQHELPKEPNLLRELKVSQGARAGEWVVGLSLGKPGERRVLRASDGADPVPLTEPGHFTSLSLAVDQRTALAAMHDGRVMELVVPDGRARVVFEAPAPLWQVVALADDQVLVACPGEVILLGREPGAPVGAPLERLDRYPTPELELPRLWRLAGGRFALAGPSPCQYLFAIQARRLHLVELFPDQARRGLEVRFDRAFLFEEPGKLREVLDFEAAWAELG